MKTFTSVRLVGARLVLATLAMATLPLARGEAGAPSMARPAGIQLVAGAIAGHADQEHPCLAINAEGTRFVFDPDAQVVRSRSAGGKETVTRVSRSAGAGPWPDPSQAPCVVSDAEGNLYFAEKNKINKISRAGLMTHFAGAAGAEPGRDGPRLEAGFSAPSRLAIDPQGNVFVGDKGDAQLRKIDVTGVVTTLFVDGIQEITSMAADASGQLYFVDSFRPTEVLKRATTGMLTFIGGTDAATAAAYSAGEAPERGYINGIAVDHAGTVYATDGEFHTLRKITRDGIDTTFAGRSGLAGIQDGTGKGAGFDSPRGIGVDAIGNVYVSDHYSIVLRKVTAAGVVTTLTPISVVHGATKVIPRP